MSVFFLFFLVATFFSLDTSYSQFNEGTAHLILSLLDLLVHQSINVSFFYVWMHFLLPLTTTSAIFELWNRKCKYEQTSLRHSHSTYTNTPRIYGLLTFFVVAIIKSIWCTCRKIEIFILSTKWHGNHSMVNKRKIKLLEQLEHFFRDMKMYEIVRNIKSDKKIPHKHTPKHAQY